MGIIWKSTMPLLSTLAALVIIVHSAEEDLDQEFRYHLRPRGSETVTPHSEQAWRPLEAEPMMQQTIRPDAYEENSSEEQPKHRRPLRKRKRRPLKSVHDLEPQERRVKEELPAHYHEEEEIYQTTEQSKRRRKRPDIRPMRWIDEPLDTDRPLRRRLQRKRRPRPELSEFNGYRDDPPEYNEQKREERNNPSKTDYYISSTNDQRDQIDREETIENETTHGYIDSEGKFIEQRNLRNDYGITVENGDVVVQATSDERDTHERVQRKEDKSLSEFSPEIIDPVQNSADEMEIVKQKLADKYTKMFNDYKSESKGPIDPRTLKDILKRSNGTSLSEILHQHNLSLADLLHGRENAISVLKSEDYLKQKYEPNSIKRTKPLSEITSKENQKSVEEEEEIVKVILPNAEMQNATDTRETAITKLIKNETIFVTKEENTETATIENTALNIQENLQTNLSVPKIANKLRFPVGIRRKLRMKPMLNNTFKAQLSRDATALSTRRYFRNATKFKEWRDTVPLMINSTSISELMNNKLLSSNSNNKTISNITTTTFMPDEITIDDMNTYNITTVSKNIHSDHDNNNSVKENIDKETTQVASSLVAKITTEIVTQATSTEVIFSTTEKPKSTPVLRPPTKNIELRRQAFNNRLKKKRLKQKNLTSEPPKEDTMKDLFGMTNLVSASEFIAKVQTPTTEDFTTTETIRAENNARSTRPTTNRTYIPVIATTTEDTAKIEIEEIFNDTRTSARLSRILKERNMTLKELVQLRERGSSHVHLADIFHNASKEPNPPEPFLSKSLIEPISKETYPLRALLEANLHEPTAKATTIDPTAIEMPHLNIPVVMDFGNNVNENGENMGIMSLFNKFAENVTDKETEVDLGNSLLRKDSNGTTYVTSTVSVNTSTTTDAARRGHVLDNNNQDVDWNDIFTLMQRNYNNDTEVSESVKDGPLSTENNEKYFLNEDLNGDGLIILVDLQHLKDFDSNIASSSEENLEVNMHRSKNILPQKPVILINNTPSSTKSITVAVASIVGLSMVLFLLTYAIFKWMQQRKLLRKKDSFSGERIPTPIFEVRKGNKIHSSSRSLSPMISTSNLYTMSTLDSHNGHDSPDYMWDTLRKPFQ